MVTTMHAPCNLPDDVVVSILVRLPARSIARFRAVCRAWRSAVSQPSFDRVHAQCPAAVAKATVATDLAGTETSVAFDFFRGRWRRDKTLPSPRTLWFTSSDYPSTVTVLGSWDGIVCMQRRILKLCFFDLEPSTSTMDVWVLDDYDAVPQRSWRLKERISLVTWDKSNLSPAFSKVEVVQSVHDGEEIFFHKYDGRIYAYNLVDKVWRTVNVSKSSYWSTSVSLVMHRESVLPGEVSFGEALSPALSPMFQRNGQQSYCL